MFPEGFPTPWLQDLFWADFNGTRFEGTPNGQFQLDALDTRGRLTGARLALMTTEADVFLNPEFFAHRKAPQILLLLDGGSTGGPGRRHRMVDLPADGTVRIDRTWLLDARSGACVVAQGSNRWLLWSPPRPGRPGDDEVQPAQGMRLGPTGVPVGVTETPGVPVQARLTMSRRYWEGWPWNVVAQPNGWTILGRGSGGPSPEFVSMQPCSWLGRLQVPAGGLRDHAEPPPAARRRRMPP